MKKKRVYSFGDGTADGKADMKICLVVKVQTLLK